MIIIIIESAIQQEINSKFTLKLSRQKITPIVLTIVSTALGLTPFLLSGDVEAFWFALAVGAIGGLSFSLLVLILVVPLFFVSSSFQ